MANVTTKNLGLAVRNVLGNNSNLSDEAEKMGVSEEELISLGDKIYHDKSDSKWEKVKRLSKRRTKKSEKSLTPKGSVDSKINVPNLKNNESDVFDSEIDLESNNSDVNDSEVQVPDVNYSKIHDPKKSEIEKFIEEEKELKRELITKLAELENMKQISVIRDQDVADSKEFLEKAKSAFEQAQQAFNRAKQNVLEKEQEVKRTEEMLAKVQDEIKNKSVYLLDPWYKGDIPEYGIFISSAEVDGIATTVEQVEPTYMPDDSVEGIFLFDYVPDYKKACAFIGLITKYIVEDKPFQKLISDKRVLALIEMVMK